MKILVLDGGGVFGNAQATILQRIDAFEKFDCFVGTSIGAAIAAAIAIGEQDKVDQQFFHKWMPLFITAANVGSRTLKVFSPETDSGWLLWEVVRAATAAETYFPSWKGYADGGVFANNPSMVGVAGACKALGQNLEDIEVLSIGTGKKPASGGRGPVSIFGWGAWLVDALLEGASDDMHDYFVNSLPVKKYTRIQFASEGGWKMDSPEDMMKAQAAWAQDMDKAITVVKAF